VKWRLLLGVFSSFAAMWLGVPLSIGAGDVKTSEKKVVQKDVVMTTSLPEEVIAGSAFNLKITVQNQSKAQVVGRTMTKYWDFDLDLVDSKGKPVPFTRFGKMAYGDARKEGSGIDIEIAAGESMEVTLNIARVFDLTREGEYTLSLTRELQVAGQGIVLKIEEIKFKVVAGP
jgi:hypothetical protein